MTAPTLVGLGAAVDITRTDLGAASSDADLRTTVNVPFPVGVASGDVCIMVIVHEIGAVNYLDSGLPPFPRVQNLHTDFFSLFNSSNRWNLLMPQALRDIAGGNTNSPTYPRAMYRNTPQDAVQRVRTSASAMSVTTSLYRQILWIKGTETGPIMARVNTGYLPPMASRNTGNYQGYNSSMSWFRLPRFYARIAAWRMPAPYTVKQLFGHAANQTPTAFPSAPGPLSFIAGGLAAVDDGGTYATNGSTIAEYGVAGAVANLVPGSFNGSQTSPEVTQHLYRVTFNGGDTLPAGFPTSSPWESTPAFVGPIPSGGIFTLPLLLHTGGMST